VDLKFLFRVAMLAGVAGFVAFLPGCAGQRPIRRIGTLSQQPIFRINVGTSVEIRWPEIEYEQTNSGDAGTIP